MTEIFTGKNLEEAKAAASAKFGVPQSKIEFEIIEEGKKGFLGMGHVDAKVKAVYNPPAPAETAVKPAVKAEPVKEEPAEITASKTEIKSEPAVEEKISAPEIKTEPVKTESAAVDEIKEEKAPETEKSDDEEEYSLDKFTLIEDESQLHPKAKIAFDYIKGIIAAMDIKAEYKIYQNENGAVINIDSDSNGTIIGRRGDTLDAVQYLSSMIANKGDKEYFRITIDCFGYREKRKATLQQLAEKVAKSVLRTGRSQPLEPMNPYERRVIHSAISKIDGVSSRSVGDEPYRKIIISSVNGRRNGNDKRRGGGRKNFDRQHESKKIDLSTSFEKDYKRPKPEDTIEGGLYGKIEF